MTRSLLFDAMIVLMALILCFIMIAGGVMTWIEGMGW